MFFDANGDGVFDDAVESGVQGVVVNLLDGTGAAVSDGAGGFVTTSTDVNGFYQFNDLTPGNSYQVEFVAPTGQEFTTQDAGVDDSVDSDADLVTGRSQVVTLGDGENNLTIDAGLIDTPVVPPVLASLGDRVFFDANGDGVFDDAVESGVQGVIVNLLDGTGAAVSDGAGGFVTTSTDVNGFYQFNDLTPGNSYQVEFVAPTGQEFTTQDAGVDDSVDSDADLVTGRSQVVTLGDGENNSTIDAGLIDTPVVPPVLASLGNRVFFDANGDGVFDDAVESGVQGVVVNLLDGTGAAVSDGAGGFVTTSTDVNGFYQFNDLTPGNSYQVEFVAPTGQEFTTRDAGVDDSVDSDADTTTGRSQVVTLGDGENNSTIDAGLIDTPVVPPVLASLGDRVFFDANGDGVFDDAVESGVQGVVVNLLDGTGAAVSDGAGGFVTTSTDVNGFYQFNDLTPGNSYQVEFVAPTGQEFTTQDAGVDDSVDSDADLVTGRSQVVTLGDGENNSTIDAGLIDTPVVPPVLASLGDRVFFDANGDGVFDDAVESGVQGVVVNLLDGTGAAVSDGAGGFVTTSTDVNGFYQFNDLTPGNSYQVEFVAPTGQEFTTRDAGVDDSVDSDADTTTGRSQVVTLGDGENNSTIDAGLIDTPVVPPVLASLGR